MTALTTPGIGPGIGLERRTGTVIVSQLGARMHYAVPRILATHSRLAHFYTDICATKGWPALVNRLPKRLLPTAVRRLVGRVPAGVPAGLTTVFPFFGVRSAVRRLAVEDVAAETSHAIWAGRRFSQLVARDGFHGASGLYAFAGDALEQMRAAKQLGMWTAVEQMIAPRDTVEALVNQEIHDHPDWAGAAPANPFVAGFAERERAEWQLADMIVCPSQFVRDHVAAQGGPVERCVVVPYGVDTSFRIERGEREPGPLRVLTVGEVGLRKGSPYVVEAARQLGADAVVRMVGGTRIPVSVQASIGAAVQLAGIVPRADMVEQLQWADVFLLPSICEGSATAVYEALSAGLPVITTANTGSVVRHGHEGYIVPIRDPGAIVRCIRHLIANPDIREDMAQSAKVRAADFTVARYGERLMAALSTLDQHEDRP